MQIDRQARHAVETEDDPVERSHAAMIDDGDDGETAVANDPDAPGDRLLDEFGQVERVSVSLETEMPPRAAALVVTQLGLVAGLWLAGEAMIAEGDGDPPKHLLRIEHLDLAFAQVREVVGRLLVDERRPGDGRSTKRRSSGPGITSWGESQSGIERRLRLGS